MKPPRRDSGDIGAYAALSLAALFWSGNFIAGRAIGDLGHEARPVDEQHLAPFSRGALRHHAPDTLGSTGDDQHLARKTIREDHAVTSSVGANFS